ncbi:hypothetical protein QBC37DRAFT_402671 [Rhypophila decipiens]|uniref:Uncharacterized protein n=1 Tax=Rhypophila decipiens TaxID=261697 RepID=A0AAN6Y2X0_9PEZI|nr:hypothetical protein QBC37DRAFT_402671 [Rhypophila decipiens]
MHLHFNQRTRHTASAALDQEDTHRRSPGSPSSNGPNVRPLQGADYLVGSSVEVLISLQSIRRQSCASDIRSTPRSLNVRQLIPSPIAGPENRVRKAMSHPQDKASPKGRPQVNVHAPQVRILDARAHGNIEPFLTATLHTDIRVGFANLVYSSQGSSQDTAGLSKAIEGRKTTPNLLLRVFHDYAHSENDTNCTIRPQNNQHHAPCVLKQPACFSEIP